MSSELAAFLWPVIAVLLAILAIHRIGADARPIFVAVVKGVAKNAGSNATAYAIALMFGLSASLSAFYDVFSQLDSTAMKTITWHQYLGLWAKVLNPFIVAVLAYATQNKFTTGPLAPHVGSAETVPVVMVASDQPSPEQPPPDNPPT